MSKGSKIARQYLAQILLLITSLRKGETLKLDFVKVTKKDKTPNGFLFEVSIPSNVDIDTLLSEIIE